MTSPVSSLSSLAEREEWFRVEIAEGKRDFLMRLSTFYIDRFQLWDEIRVEELVGAVMWRAWSNLSKFDPTKGSLQNWLGTILKNRAINCSRDRNRRTKTILGIYSEAMQWYCERSPSSDLGGLNELILEERKEILRRAIDKLPKNQKQLVLWRLDGKRYDEMAEMAGVIMGTVKSRLNRAKEVLSRDPELRELVGLKSFI